MNNININIKIGDKLFVKKELRTEKPAGSIVKVTELIPYGKQKLIGKIYTTNLQGEGRGWISPQRFNEYFVRVCRKCEKSSCLTLSKGEL